MNRHERRKAKALSRLGHKSDGPTVVAVHEAGHAVAKVLAIGELGYSIHEAIEYIVMGTNKSLARSANRKMMLRSQGVTFGHTFSKDMAAAASRESVPSLPFRAWGAKPLDLVQNRRASRAAGADVGKWFRARVFDAVTGSIAEAIFTKQTFHDVWNGYQAESDQISVVRDAHISGISTNEINSTIDRMAALSAYLMEKPEVWAGVLALANKLPPVGRMDGDEAVAIITKALSEFDLSGMFADGLEGIAELEQEIRANKIVAARTPDGSNNVIKGKELITKMKDEVIDRVEFLPYQCTFPVFGETLWRAFGDGASQKS